MPDNGSIQKRGAHEMAHGRPVQITERTTVTELQPSLSDVVCANKKLQIGFIVALVVLALLSGFVARPHFADTKTWDSTIVSCLPCYTWKNICSRFCGRLAWAS